MPIVQADCPSRDDQPSLGKLPNVNVASIGIISIKIISRDGKTFLSAVLFRGKIHMWTSPRG